MTAPTGLAALAALTALCPPPADVPPVPDWPGAEGVLGMRLPGDYKELVAAYGPGEFNGFLTLYQPGTLNEWVDLTGPVPARLRAQLDAHHRGALPCATEDLLAMGVTGNGHYLFWDTRLRDAPDRWTVVVSERLSAPWFTYRGPVTAFLADVLGGTLRVPLFPRDLLLGDGPAFAPSRLRGRVRVTALDTRPPVSTSTIRAWARAQGFDVPDRGRVPFAVFEAWEAATRSD
ncbi:histone-like nucleoid-structuring protein Lsr2 [Streptomyces sp. NPDC090301]|uniref:Lsr2 family DNA-binding protein n=1 Tax=Streptomyces sp. NPDC090301 TaxID=3154975 RepID=UPI0034273239